MIINHNMIAMNSHRASGINSSGMGKSIEKLSSGMKINRAGDDAAGLYISEKMRGQIRGLSMASKNAQDGISLIQTAEGALDEVHSMLQRMRELAVQAANDTNVSEDRTALQAEIDQLASEITAISSRSEFNTQTLLDGSFSGKIFHIGANDGQSISLTISAMDASALGVASLDLETQSGADTAIASVDTALSTVSSQRAALGAVQNRLEHTIKNLDNSAENLQAAESRIRDTDMAKEMSSFTKSNILAQASQAMLAQANQLPQQVLQLLR